MRLFRAAGNLSWENLFLAIGVVYMALIAVAGIARGARILE
jgi:hypothetical protein